MVIYKYGSRGFEVQMIQNALGWEGINSEFRKLSYSVSKDDWDGIYGAGTVRAVKIFQQKMGLPVTGEVDDRTWDYLVGGIRPTPLPTPEEIWKVPLAPGVKEEIPWLMPRPVQPIPTLTPILTPISKPINWILVTVVSAAVIIGIIAIMGRTKPKEAR